MPLLNQMTKTSFVLSMCNVNVLCNHASLEEGSKRYASNYYHSLPDVDAMGFKENMTGYF